jgi:hypothetical protein
MARLPAERYGALGGAVMGAAGSLSAELGFAPDVQATAA